MKIMVVESGHSFSTSDCVDGICYGLSTIEDVEVVRFQWEKPLRIMSTIMAGAIENGTVPPAKAEHFRSFTSWLAAADSISVALDQEVDAVIVVNGILFPPSRAKLLQKLGIPVACFGTEAPYFLKTEQDIAPFYTHWFTNEKMCVGMFGDTKQFYLRHAYNPALHQRGDIDIDRMADVVFIGGGYPERKALLSGVDWTGIDLQTRGTLWHLDLQAEQDATDIGRSSRYSDGAIPNTETSAWHRSARIALNMNRRMTHVETGESIVSGTAQSLGPRAFEIPAVGGFMLSDDERLAELTAIYGDSAAMFAAWDSADLARQVRYWLTHDDARERARAAQWEAVQPHHWGNRAMDVLNIILN